MAKKKEASVVRVIAPQVKDCAYGYTEYEISEEVLREHGTVVSKTEPDVFGVFANQLVKVARDILGI